MLVVHFHTCEICSHHVLLSHQAMDDRVAVGVGPQLCHGTADLSPKPNQQTPIHDHGGSKSCLCCIFTPAKFAHITFCFPIQPWMIGLLWDLGHTFVMVPRTCPQNPTNKLPSMATVGASHACAAFSHLRNLCITRFAFPSSHQWARSFGS